MSALIVADSSPSSPNVDAGAFPPVVGIEDVPVSAFENASALFERILHEIARPGQSLIHYLNIHVANTAFANPRLKQALQSADVVYCDGAGIMAGARIIGQSLPTRLTGADWFTGFLACMAEHGKTVYLLGGEPGIPEAAMAKLSEAVPNHTVVGMHHGYILNSPEIEQRVFHEINRLEPDVLIVGFGTPLQELWVARHRDRLQASVIFPLGAVLDYFAGKVPRCPAWMGQAGLEWLFRFCVEPRRLVGRYIIGNPWFLGRMALRAMSARLNGFTRGMFYKPLTASRHYFL